MLCENHEKVTGRDKAEALAAILTAAGSGDADAGCAVLAYPEATVVAVEGTTSTVGEVAKELERARESRSGQGTVHQHQGGQHHRRHGQVSAAGRVAASFVNSPTAEAYEELEPERVFKATSAVNVCAWLGMKLR